MQELKDLVSLKCRSRENFFTNLHANIFDFSRYNVTYHDRQSMYFEYCEDRETSVLMVCIEIQRHYRITNKSH